MIKDLSLDLGEWLMDGWMCPMCPNYKLNLSLPSSLTFFLYCSVK